MYTYLQYGFWTLTVIFQITAGVLLARRRLYREVPAFFSYTLFQVFRSLTLFIVLQLLARHTLGYALYFKVYWITDAISVALCIVLIFEIARTFLREYELARQIVTTCLMFGAVVLLVSDVFLVRTFPGNESHRLISMILLLDRSLAILQAGLVLVLLIAARMMAIPWRTNLPFGISLGLGLVGTVNLASDAVRAQYGPAQNIVFDLARTFSYVLAALVWLVYIVPSRRTESVADLSDLSDAANDWSDALTELVR